MPLVLKVRPAPKKTADITLTFRQLEFPEDTEGNDLINRLHYQGNGNPGAKMIGCFIENSVLKELNASLVKPTSEKSMLVGVITLNRGFAYTSPKGRQHLAKKHFPLLNLRKFDRGQLVEKMKLSRISRIAVEPELQGFGIGTQLALESRRVASALLPGTQFIEVMTSQRFQDAQNLLKAPGKERDFLQRAGFSLAPNFTRIQKEKRIEGRDRRLYYWAPILK